MEEMHLRLRIRSARLASAGLIASLAVACSATGTPALTALPDGIPVPADASVVVGQAAGYDAGAALYAFTSDLGPGVALHQYAVQLSAAGFRRTGSSGTWALYRHGATTVAVQVGESGPPTDVLVRVIVPSAGGPAGGGSAGSAPGSGSTGGAGSAGSAGGLGGGTSTAGSAGTAGSTGSGGQAAGAAANGNALGAGGGNPEPGTNGAANGNPTSNAGGNPAPGANGAANGNPTGNAGGNPDPGANGSNGQSSATTPVPEPPPPHGQPVTPPGQATPSPGT